MGGNGRGGRVTGRNRLIGVGEGISTVDSSITWAKMTPTTDPPASANGYSGHTGVLAIGIATTTLNASSIKGSGAGESKNLIENGSVIVVSPVIIRLASKH